jgi:hypothetical protein
MITLITMSQGNPVALKRTLGSFKGLCNEVIFGDLLVFPADRVLIESYGVKMVPLPFNYIFKNGFASTLNELAKYATNEWVLYMNCSEVLESGDIVITNANANCYCFDHATDPHRWFRLYNRTELQWAGIIHEELVGRRRPQPEPMFRMADTDKDSEPWKAKVYNDIKELVYFKQYLRLVDEPGIIGITNMGWVNYARESYQHIKDRLEGKGRRLEAFENGDLQLYLNEIYQPDFTEEFKDSDIIHFQ